MTQHLGERVAMINQKRLTEEFLELTAIPSLSRQEGQIARRLESILKGDGSQRGGGRRRRKVGGNTGNILARFTGTDAAAAPLPSRATWTPWDRPARSGP